MNPDYLGQCSPQDPPNRWSRIRHHFAWVHAGSIDSAGEKLDVLNHLHDFEYLATGGRVSDLATVCAREFK